MGAEDFQVRLWSRASLPAAEQVIASQPGVHSTEQYPFPDCRYFLYEDPGHVIELALASDGGGSTVSVRFALCHPDSIEEVFARLVLDLATRLDAAFVILDTVDDEEPDELDWTQGEAFRRALAPALRQHRGYWQRSVGTERARLTSPQAVVAFMLPRCIPRA